MIVERWTMAEKFIPKRSDNRYTIKSLGLDLAAAENGKTWKLLPEGWRAMECGQTYPLPGRRHELQKIATIYVPPHHKKRDSGCAYIRRAMKAWTERQKNYTSAVHDVGMRANQIKRSQHNYTLALKKCRQDARDIVDEVREEAVKAVATLNDLFALSRKGLEGQMKAHLDGKEWQGERITSAAFRQCSKIVLQGVKGLGLPSDQRKPASDAVMEELAAALQATQEAVGMAPTIDLSEVPGDEKLN
jgi:hypothetical protein